MSDFNVQLKPSADEIAKFLQSIPGAAKRAVRLSIMDALKSGRSLLANSNEGIRARYNLPLSPLLAALGTPRVIGDYGFLNIEGKRLPLSLFKHSFTSHGVEIEILKGKPSVLAHAFRVYDDSIFERELGASRYPIHPMVTTSIPSMAAVPEISKKVVARINEQLSKRSIHYIEAFLAGKIQDFNRKK